MNVMIRFYFPRSILRDSNLKSRPDKCLSSTTQPEMTAKEDKIDEKSHFFAQEQQLLRDSKLHFK